MVYLFLINSFSIKAQILPLPEHTEWESYTSIPLASNSSIVGLVFDLNSNKLKPESFYSYIPKKHRSYLCVQIFSIDGKYIGRRSYDIKNLQEGFYEFIYPTSLKEILSRYSQNEIIIKAALENECTFYSNNFTFSSWNKPAKNFGRLSLFLNVDYLSQTKIIFANNQTMDGVCSKTGANYRYKSVCIFENINISSVKILQYSYLQTSGLAQKNETKTIIFN